MFMTGAFKLVMVCLLSSLFLVHERQRFRWKLGIVSIRPSTALEMGTL